MITCITLFGKEKTVNESEIFFRPSAYGVIQHENKILVVNTKSTGKWSLPGGGINSDEKIEDGLKREIREEVGIEVQIQKFIHFYENYFYYDPLNEAMNCYQYFFLCKPLQFILAAADKIDDLEAENPQWLPINSLNEENLQIAETGILQVLRKLSTDGND